MEEMDRLRTIDCVLWTIGTETELFSNRYLIFVFTCITQVIYLHTYIQA